MGEINLNFSECVKTYAWNELVGKTLRILEGKDGDTTVICGFDLRYGVIYVLAEITKEEE